MSLPREWPCRLVSPRQRRPWGFTIVELMAALVISGVVLLAARVLLDELGDAGQHIAGSAAREDHNQNAWRMLKQRVSQVETGSDGAHRFFGGSTAARFSSWCEVPGGWEESCVAEMLVDTIETRPALVLVVGSGPAIVIAVARSTATFRYITDYGNAATWARSWNDESSAPLGLAVILDSDTTVLRIGERG